jgi:dihydrofolate reductase
MSPRRELQLIVAMAKNRCIGSEGGLPWHVPEDLKRFKRLTKGHAVIMGRKTYESIGHPLEGRRNIVVSRRQGLAIEGCEVVTSVAEAVELAHETDAAPFVIGGATIYEAALPRVTRIELTEIDREVAGDTFLPPFVPGEWREVAREAAETEGVAFVTLERVD